MANSSAGVNLIKGFILVVGGIITILGALAGVAYATQLILSAQSVTTDSVIRISCVA